ncbi:MAG: hypothetical protein HY903_23235 [Deltaproteobacteria bacterium]|nr:hypothetical protein [Deltaproteobacteria bacterium]
MRARCCRRLMVLAAVVVAARPVGAAPDHALASFEARGLSDREAATLRARVRTAFAEQDVELEFRREPIECPASEPASRGRSVEWLLALTFLRAGPLTKGALQLKDAASCEPRLNRQWSVSDEAANRKELERTLAAVATRLAADPPAPAPFLPLVAIEGAPHASPVFRNLPWIVGGTGVALLGVGAGFYVAALRRWSCAKDAACVGRQRAIGGTQTNERVAWVVGGVGLAAAMAGVALWALADEPAGPTVGVGLAADRAGGSVTTVVWWSTP